ncbi:MAG: hypothetical protein PUK21_07100 [Peptostreptococcaceae bacterium]|nr:hypothetical protein [Peptostreptococcaceae bacterium]
MLKNLIKIVSAILIIFSMITLMQYFQVKEQKYPFNTNISIELDVAEKSGSKAEKIQSLNNLVSKHKVVFIKSMADLKDYEHKRDIIYFGDTKLKEINPIVENNKIYWLGGQLSGSLISSEEIGERNLSGTYTHNGDQLFCYALQEWAKENNVLIKENQKDSVFETAYKFIFTNGFGNGMLTASILLVTFFLLWFVMNAKSRGIRFIAGKSIRRIHYEDTLEITKSVFGGEIVGSLIVIIFLLSRQSLALTVSMLLPFFLCFIIVLLVSMMSIYMLSIFSAPKARHVAERKAPLKTFAKISKINRFVAMLIAFIVLPTTIQGIILTKNLLEKQDVWNENNEMVSISISDYDAMVTDEMLAETEKIFNDAYSSNILTVSYVLDKGINFSSKELGGYDHIVIVNSSWLNIIHVGINQEKENGKLKKIEYEKLDKPLRESLESQLQTLIKSKEIKQARMEFYEYQGKNFIALPPGIGVGESTIKAKNPLVIVAANPVEVFKTNGFILDASTTGNVLFNDAQKLKNIISESKVKPFVTSVDYVAEESLEMAQKFSKQIIAYIISSVVVFASIFFMIALNGEIWSLKNKKRIFTLHTSGINFTKIISEPMIKEIYFAITTVIFGSAIAYFLHHTDTMILLSVILIILLLQLIFGALTYKTCSEKMFREMIHRN